MTSPPAAALSHIPDDDYAARAARRMLRGCVAIVFGVGTVAMAAWLSGAKDNSVVRLLTTMRFNAAVGFAIAGASLFADSLASRYSRPGRMAGGAIVALIAGLTVLQYLTGRSFGMDNFFVTEWRPGPGPPGRMSPQSALVLLLFGGAMLILDVPRWIAVTKVIAVTIAATAILAMSGHVMGAGPSGISWSPLGTMPMLAAVAALCCSIALLAARPTPGLGDLLFSPTLTSTIARRWLIGALVMPLLVSAVGSWLLGMDIADHTTLGAVTIAVIAVLTAAGVVTEAAYSQRLERRHLELEQRHTAMIAQLEAALTEVRTLRGLLPICSYCKRIRDTDGRWEGIESYVAHRSEAEFSHGVCPECLAKHHPDL